MLEANKISVALGGQQVVREVSFQVNRGENIAIIGPNGCGKSTLLRCLIGALRPEGGRILFEGQDVTAMSSKKRAKSMGLLPQEEAIPAMTTVFDYVCAGRYPYQSFFRGLNPSDVQSAKTSLQALEIDHLEQRVVERLSGGERQRVRLATLLAQDPHVMLLDEPMTGLDLCHQYLMLNIIAELQSNSEKIMVSVMHDIDMSLRFFSRLLVMKDGEIVADGAPREVLTDALIQEVFGIRGQIQTIQETSFPLFVCDPNQCRNHYTEDATRSFVVQKTTRD